MREQHNLPAVFDSFVSVKAKKALTGTMRSGLYHVRLGVLDFFHKNDLGDIGWTSKNDSLDLEHHSLFCGPCVGSQANKILSGPQKELLKWHWKLGISMYFVQEMMRERHYEEPDGKKTILPAIIKPKNLSARSCIVPSCQLCLLARARKRSPKILRTQALEDWEGAITRDQYEVGDFVSTDQFIC